MNKARRAALAGIVAEIANLSISLENLRDKEQEYYDSMPESFQMAERGERATDAIASLDSAIDSLESAVSDIESACA